MRPIYILCFVLVLSHLKAQDTLYFKNSTKQAVIMLEVNPDNVRYKRFNNQKGATYTVLKSDLKFILFKNGSKEVFEISETQIKNALVNIDSSNVKAPNITKTNPDTLYFRSGKIIESKILFIDEKEVRYKLYNYQDGPTYQAAKYELKQIGYGNGTIEQFNEMNTSQSEFENPHSGAYSNQTHGSNQRLYEKGKSDAITNYKHKEAAVWVGCATAGCGPFVGLLPGMLATTTDPDPDNLNIPPSAYSSQPEYLRGYTESAMKIKKRRVWSGYGIGAGIGIVFYGLLYIAFMLLLLGI